MDDNHLGEFLRARRAHLRPQDVNMASHGVRRVAGLRREEVAVLSGVNADNLARMTFLDPAGREFYQDWDRAAQAAVANLRQASGFDPEHPRLRDPRRRLPHLYSRRYAGFRGPSHLGAG